MDPARSDLLERWAASASSPCPLKAAEDAKHEHYADLPLAWKLRPCGHGTQGDMGPGAHACVNALALEIATRRNGGVLPPRDWVDSVRRELYGRLVLSMMRELANQILSKFSASPRAGLTKDNAYTHSAFVSGGFGAGSLGAPACSCGSDNAARVGCVCNAPARRGLRRCG